MKPKISVVIPIYNMSTFIDKTLESVFHQEYPAHEIIVVDDGSTDDTPAILEKYSGTIRSRRTLNSGPSASRNTGIEMATGDYIAFLDADDVWFRDRLKILAGYIEQYPNIGLYACDYVVRYEALGPRLMKHSSCLTNQQHIPLNAPIRLPYSWLLDENFVGTASAVAVKKEIAKKAGLFDTAHSLAEDLDFYLRMAMISEFILIDRILFYKRNHPDSLSHSKIPLYLGHRNVLSEISASHKEYQREHGLLKRCQTALASTNYTLGSTYFENRQIRKAFDCYVQGLTHAYTPQNMVNFIWTVLKKSLRLITFDRLSKTNLKFFLK